MKICMVSYSFYENDNRVMRYAEALAARGDQVDVLSLARNNSARIETINGVTVHRIQRREKNEQGKFSYLVRMLSFLARSACFLTTKHLRHSYDLIHVHSVPDFEVYAALIPKIMGAKVILDIHDIVPEFYTSKFGVSETSFAFRALKLVERFSAAFSDHVIISNHLWEKVLISRSVPSTKCSTYLNYPDSRMFNATRRTRGADGRIVLIYPGSLSWHQGLDIAIRALDLIKNQAPEAELHIYGEGGFKEELIRMIEERSLQNRIKLMNYKPIYEIAQIMANANIGIVPKRNDAFGDEAFSTKIFEFMALGVPVIAANTRIDRFYFNDSLVKFFQAGDERSLAEAMLVMIRNRKLRENLATSALAFIADQRWDIKKYDYLNLVDRLVYGIPNTVRSEEQ